MNDSNTVKLRLLVEMTFEKEDGTPISQQDMNALEGNLHDLALRPMQEGSFTAGLPHICMDIGPFVRVERI